MFYKYFDKKTSGGAIKTEVMPNQQLAEDLHQSIIRKLEKWKVHLSFIDNIWDDDLTDMQFISKFNNGCRFLFCVIDFYHKYALVATLKDKKCATITHAFPKILHE